MINKIILGTVQLGIPYGINNVAGKPSDEEAFRILNYAHQQGIRILDSADGYGEALQVIGRFQSSTKKDFKVINKFKIDSDSLYNKLQRGLKQSSSETLYCYMYHHFPDYEFGNCHNELEELKRKGLIEKIGISVYGVDQLKKVVDDPKIDIIQIPVNLFDLNEEKEELLKKAKASGKEIHARSIYLQGLFLKDWRSLTGNLTTLKPYLKALQSSSGDNPEILKKVALNFVIQKEYISQIVLGIDNVSQLIENVGMVDPLFNGAIFERIDIQSSDSYLLNPANWKP